MAQQKRFVARNGLDNNSQTLTSVADPVNAQDAATKNFSSNASNLTAGTLAAARLPAFSGDATSVAGSSALTLANSGVTAGTYNDVATQVRPITVDAKGRVTGIGAAVTITPAFSSITGKPTTLSGYGITDAAPLASPALTGTPTAPTATAGTNTTQIATTAFVSAAVAAALGGGSSAGSFSTLSTSGDVTIGGNLTINGTTTTVNSTVTTIDDPVITLGGDAAPTVDDGKDRGVEFRWHNGTVAKVGFFGFDDSTGKFTFIPDATNTSEAFSGTKGTLDAYLAWADVTSKPTTLAGYGITDAQALDADLTAIAGLAGTSGFLKKTAANTWSLDTSTYLTANQTVTLSGDATGSGSTAIAVTLANSGVTAGTYNNSATAVSPITVDAKGRVTGVGTAVTITPAWGSITGKPTTLAGYGITDAALSTHNHTGTYQPLDADLTAIAGLAGTSGFLKKTAADTWTLDTSAYLTANQNITVSGDASGSGTTAISLTLANSGVTAGTYKSVTVDAKGRVTAGTNPTTLAGYGITDAQALDADLTAIAGLAGTSGFLKKTGAGAWTLDTSAYLTANQSITVSGDASGSGTTAISLTLANSGVSAGTYRSVTVDAKGRVTAGTNPTTVAGYGITDAVSTSTLAGYASLSVSNTWTKTQAPANGSLTDAATIAWDGSTLQVASVTLAGNRTLGAMTGIVPEATYVLIVSQDATGGRTLAWNSVYKFAGGTVPTLTTTANAVDVFTFVANAAGTALLCIGQSKDVK